MVFGNYWRIKALVRLVIALFIPACAAPSALAQMAVDNFDEAPTANEISSFKTYIQTLTPAPDNIGNSWVQHNSGEQTKAMGLMYELTGDTAVLDQMIRFCDAVLSERNDLAAAPVGQHVFWTGRIEPGWPNTTAIPLGAGGEQGDPIGHLGNCARLILSTPAIWDINVPVGDPKGYGSTYLARAKKYVAEADYSMQQFILPTLLDLSDSNHQKFSSANGNPYMAGQIVPWNQVMMFNFAFENLSVAHAILDDNESLRLQYDTIAKANIDWFFSTVTSVTDTAGNTAYQWKYTLDAPYVEDNSHGSLDVAGLYRAYMLNRYGITAEQLIPFANTYVDIMTLGTQNYAGKVDGTTGSGNSASTNYVRAGWLQLAEVKPDIYANWMGVDFKVGNTSGAIDRWTRFMWLKYRRYLSQSGSLLPASVMIASSANNPKPNTPITFTVRVSSRTAIPSGTVNFVEGGKTLGTGTLDDGGLATFTTSALSQGSHTITAVYSGDTMLGASTSAGFTQTVAVAQLVLTPAQTSATVRAGQSATYTLNASTDGTVLPAVSFSCSGLPAGAVCTFNPNTINASGTGTPVTLTVTTTAPSVAALSGPVLPRSMYACFLLVPAMVLVAAGRGNAQQHNVSRKIGLAPVILLMVLMVGCGGSGTKTTKDNRTTTPTPTGGTQPGTYTFSVTSTSGANKTTTPLTLIVQ